MNFVGLTTQLQVEVSEENPDTDSDGAPEKHPNHPHLEQMRLVLSSRSSEVVAGKQAGTVQGALRKDLGNIERHLRQEWENAKKHLRPPAIAGMPAGTLEDMGILVGEVYDEKITEEFH